MDIATNLSQREDEQQDLGPARERGRRGFLKMLAGGAGITAAITASGCDFTVPNPGGGNNNAPAVNLGSGDIGVLNFALTLERLEAEFYTMAAANMFGGATQTERDVIINLRNHEIIHAEFLATAINAAAPGQAVTGLRFDFSSVDFDSRQSVLATARMFEDLGVAAYNGAGKLLMSPDLLAIAGKIVSVEARHASAIRGLITPRSRFTVGDDVLVTGPGTTDPSIDRALMPMAVLRMADPFVRNPINASLLFAKKANSSFSRSASASSLGKNWS